jgi:hypothetical protein
LQNFPIPSAPLPQIWQIRQTNAMNGLR